MSELVYVKYKSLRRPLGVQARQRAKKRRAEGPMLKAVRATVDERDGYCRLMGLSPCRGVSQLAHLADKKRARTRGMAPEERHTTAGTMKACERHHGLYDAGTILIAMTEQGADGPIRASEGEHVKVC